VLLTGFRYRVVGLLGVLASKFAKIPPATADQTLNRHRLYTQDHRKCSLFCQHRVGGCIKTFIRVRLAVETRMEQVNARCPEIQITLWGVPEGFDAQADDLNELGKKWSLLHIARDDKRMQRLQPRCAFSRRMCGCVFPSMGLFAL